MLGCSLKQLPYAQYMHRQGVNLIIVDKSSTIDLGFAVKHLVVGYDQVKVISRAIKDYCVTPDFIFTAADQISHIYACELAEELNITYRLSKDLVKTINSKFRFYEWFVDHGIDIPKTNYLYDRNSLGSVVRSYIKSGQIVYVKSDCSKNPRYVYKIETESEVQNINWTKDRYLQEGYVVQPFIEGVCYRLNFFNGKCITFDFATSTIVTENSTQVKHYLPKLKKFISKHRLQNEIVKFDVIDNNSRGIKVLDIGLDPPSRLRNYCNRRDLNFVAAYCELAQGKSQKMNELFEDVIQSTR